VVSSSASLSSSQSLFAAMRAFCRQFNCRCRRSERAGGGEAGEGAEGPVARTAAASQCLWQRWRRLVAGAILARDGVGRLQEIYISCKPAEWH
jgi:hypothetical protein